MAALPKTPDLVTITTPGGASFRVAKIHQAQFQGLVNDLEAGGYTIDPKTSGGFNSRYIAGTTTPSEHAFGRAIDVNWQANARGRPGDIPGDVAQSLADKYGMTWGGTWKNRDDMHFEIRRSADGTAVPVAVRNSAPSDVPAMGNFGMAKANLPSDVGGDYGGGGDLNASDQPAEPGLDPEQLRALLMLQQGGGLAGRLGGVNSLSGALTQGMQPTPVEPQPILQPSIIGGPLPIARRLT